MFIFQNNLFRKAANNQASEVEEGRSRMVGIPVRINHNERGGSEGFIIPCFQMSSSANGIRPENVHNSPGLETGDKVTLEMNNFDLSEMPDCLTWPYSFSNTESEAMFNKYSAKIPVS